MKNGVSLVSINSYQQLSSLVSPISPLSSIWQRFYFKLVCVCACSHACTCSHVQESCEARRSLVAGVTGGCEPACVCWKWNLGLAQEQALGYENRCSVPLVFIPLSSLCICLVIQFTNSCLLRSSTKTAGVLRKI